MRHAGVCLALLLDVIGTGTPMFAAVPTDPFTVDRNGEERRAAAASLSRTFRIETPDRRTTCSQWRVMTLVSTSSDERAWQLVRSARADSNHEVQLFGIPGRTTLVAVECPGRPGYSLHGPHVWGGRRSDPGVIQIRWRRTVRVSAGMRSLQTVRMVLPQQYEGERWPECRLRLGDFSECIGVPYEARGVAINEGREGLSWALAEPRAASIQVVSSVAARWGRLLYFVDTIEGAGDDLGVTVWREKPGASGASRPRVRFVADALTQAYELGPRAVWVVGRGQTSGRFVEVTAGGATTMRVDADRLTDAAAQQPLRLFLRPAVPVAGTIVDSRGTPAVGALVSLFELIRPRAPSGETVDDEVVARRWMAETISDSEGRFLLNGPPPGRYEFLAVHPTQGRTVGDHRVDGRPVALRLRSTPRVTGRVVREDRPLAGVAVRSVPDQQVFARAADPVALLAPGVLTNQYGEFELSLPEQGRGEIVIGGKGLPTIRRPYTEAEDLPVVTDLGDVVLQAATPLTVRLPLGGCELVAVGPLGALGLSRVGSTFDPRDRVYRFSLPEAGFWWLEATCNRASEPLVPSVVRVDGASAGRVLDATFASAGRVAP